MVDGFLLNVDSLSSSLSRYNVTGADLSFILNEMNMFSIKHIITSFQKYIDSYSKQIL